MQRHATCPSRPDFPTQILCKRRRGMNASLFVNIVKKTGRTYHWAQFLSKRMGGSLKTIEGWVKKPQGSGRAAPKQNRTILHGEIFTCPPPFEIHPDRSGPTSYSYNPRALAKNLQNEWVQVKKYPYKMVLFCSPTNFYSTWHVVGRYILPRFLTSLLFRIWALLACLDPVAKKRHRFVGTCCSAISLSFPHSALNCL